MSRGLAVILLYLAGSRLLNLLLSPVFAHTLKRLGIVHALILGQLTMPLSFLLFTQMDRSPWLVLGVLMLLRAVDLGVYWTAHHIFLSSELKLSHIGNSIGVFTFLTGLATIVAPLLGVLTASAVNYQTVFLIGMVIQLASIVFLLGVPNIHTRTLWHWSDFRHWLRGPGARSTAATIGGQIWESIGMSFIWPIFLFINLNNLNSVGYILSAAAFLAWLLSYFAGVSFDHRQIKTPLRVGSGALLGLLWFPRWFFAAFPIMLVFIDAIDKISCSVYDTVIYASIVVEAKSTGVLLFFMNRQVVISLVESMGAIFFLLLLHFTWNWPFVFLSFLLAVLSSVHYRPKTEWRET
jgi:hypothetical protein